MEKGKRKREKGKKGREGKRKKGKDTANTSDQTPSDQTPKHQTQSQSNRNKSLVMEGPEYSVHSVLRSHFPFPISHVPFPNYLRYSTPHSALARCILHAALILFVIPTIHPLFTIGLVLLKTPRPPAAFLPVSFPFSLPCSLLDNSKLNLTKPTHKLKS